MKADRYTKFILTLIAGMLAWQTFSPGSLQNAQARNGYQVTTAMMPEGGGALMDSRGNTITQPVVGFGCSSAGCYIVTR
jgi:hypothetical protein